MALSVVGFLREKQGSRGEDAFFVAAGAGGELLVARIRLLLVGLLFVTQIAPPGVGPMERRLGLGLSLFGLVFAPLAYVAVMRLYRPWMGFLTSALDVTFVSCGLAVHLLFDRPHTAVNSKIIFDIYYLAMACSALRYDWRICALSTALAVAEYAAIVAYATSHWHLNDPRYAPFAQGMFFWNQQVSRLILLTCAGVASTAIVLRARGLRRLSAIDRLTGLTNRGAIDERLTEEASRARRYQRPLTVAIVDIDHFKRFNDTHGHHGGDLALRAVADVLRQSVRQSDIVARYGGEEFVLVLPETLAADARTRMESLREAVAAAAVPIRPASDASSARVTVSIGLAGLPDDGAEIDQVVAAADARLYEAKRAGRDRVVGPGAVGRVPEQSLG